MFWDRLKTWTLFRFANLRRIDSFPFITYHDNSRKITMKEAREGFSYARVGDIILYRNDNMLSNLAVPGAFKHAAIVVENNDCIESINHRIARRDNFYTFLSDYVIILRPIFANKTEVNKAIDMAKMEIGNPMADKVFGPTEFIAKSWYHNGEKLNICKSKHRSMDVYKADDFVKMNFGIIWKSASTTPIWAEKSGMNKDGVQKIKEFIEGIRDFNEYGNPVLRR